MVEHWYYKPECAGSSLGHITLFSSFLKPFSATIFSKFFFNCNDRLNINSHVLYSFATICFHGKGSQVVIKQLSQLIKQCF